MILFEKIRWKNFLSTGNQFTEVDFQISSTTLIIGVNGAGKSTILDALTFSLFGKPYRKINKPQLLNSVNDKDCLVEIEFSVGNTRWKIRRGIKPNIFEIHKNGKVLDQHASANDQQKWFEQSVLKMNYKSFTQIVILGSASFIPFMQLSVAHRREVIEDLLDLKIFSSMNVLIKENIRSAKDSIKTLELKKDSLKDKVDMQKDFIKQIEESGQKGIDQRKTKIDSISNEINEVESNTQKIVVNIEKKQKQLEDYIDASAKVRKLTNLRAKIEQKKDNIDKEGIFFNQNAVCPTCTQNIEEDFRLNRIEVLSSSIRELDEGLSELETKIEEEETRELQFLNLSKEVTKLTNGISQSNVQIFGLRKQSRDLESEIQEITEKLANRGSEHEKLETFKEQLNNTFKLLSEQRDEIDYLDYTYSLLKDSGVKSNIIKKYLPLINQSVNKYLQMMDFYINLQLDEEFNEVVQSPIHEDFTYSSFSEGEKQRIDLALLFTWREIAKIKNSANTNIMIFDEVFDSSLDTVGTEEFLKIIRFVIKDANIFVISHKGEIADKFESVIKFEKIKGFSRISST
jgi:DNA repair exonuclease SbcCD ATPase subunit